jgi:hypothetical protein
LHEGNWQYLKVHKPKHLKSSMHKHCIMKKILLIFVSLVLFSKSYAQFNDPLFNLSVGKSTKLKKEKAIIDSVSTLWYQTLEQTSLIDYVMPNDTMPVFDEVEQKAEYEDGMYKLLEYLEKYKPKNTDSTTFAGLNIVKFIISDKGDVLAPQIVHSTCDACQPFTIKMFNEMPRWKPAKQYDIPVYTFYTIPIFY